MTENYEEIKNVIFQIKEVCPHLKTWGDLGVPDYVTIEIRVERSINSEIRMETYLELYSLMDFIYNLTKNGIEKRFDDVVSCYFLGLIIHSRWYGNRRVLIEFEDRCMGIIHFQTLFDSVKKFMEDLISVMEVRDPNDMEKQKGLFMDYWKEIIMVVEEWKQI